jgi:hypothetical protein
MIVVGIRMAVGVKVGAIEPDAGVETEGAAVDVAR